MVDTKLKGEPKMKILETKYTKNGSETVEINILPKIIKDELGNPCPTIYVEERDKYTPAITETKVFTDKGEAIIKKIIPAYKIHGYNLEITVEAKDRDSLMAEIAPLGLKITREWYQTPFGNWEMTLAHPATLILSKKLAKIKEDKKSRCNIPGYVRFGKVPKNQRSKNYADGMLEAGVSCFRVLFSDKGDFIPQCPTPATEMTFVNLSHTRNEEIYRLWGEEVGTGSDGEPLLKVTKAKKLSLCRAKKEVDQRSR